MKRIICLLLVCVMLSGLVVSVSAAWKTDAIEVAQSDGMTYEQLNAELTDSGDAGAYDWSGAVSLSGTAYGSYAGTAQFKITHAGDYLYIYTKVPTISEYRYFSENFVYVDLTSGDDKVDYIIITKPNYAPYMLGTEDVRYYQSGVTDKPRQNDEWTAKNVSVNKGSGLDLGILFGRNVYQAKTAGSEEDCIFHIAVPLSEENKTALEDGSCDIGVGFAYIQAKTSGAERYYTNCGEFTLDNASNIGNDFYDDITEEKLTTLTLKKGTDTTTPENVITPPVSGGDTGDDDEAILTGTDVPQSDGMTYEQLNAELVDSGDAGAYDWSGALSLSGTAYGVYTGTAQFKITHAGDYLYIYTRVPTIYTYRSESEEFIYVDLKEGDGKVDYIIVMKPNYGPYLLNGTKVSYYQEGVVDRARQGDDANWGPPYNNTVNKASGLALDILFGRNDYVAENSEDCIYHVAIPLSEENKTALEDGSCSIGVGFAYIQAKTKGPVGYYTNCGEFTLDNTSNIGNDFYDDITEDKLTTLTLHKGTDTTTPEGVIDSENDHGTGGDGSADLEAQMKQWVEADRNRTYDVNLEDLTVNILGDSYFDGQTDEMHNYVWPNLLASKYYWKFNNYGENGGLVSSYVANGNKEPMVTRYMDMADNKANLIIVNGGRNDYNNEVPLGTVDSTDPKTFMGALNVLIDGLQEKYPKAMIMFTTVWNFGGTNDIGLTSADYANAMIRVCEAQGVYCFKANDPSVSGVDMTDSTFRATNCLTDSDVSHLNVNGMKLVMPKFEAFITECYADYLEKNPVVIPPVSKDDEETDATTDTDTDTEAETEAVTDEAEGGCGSSIGIAGFAIVAVAATVASLGKAKKTSRNKNN